MAQDRAHKKIAPPDGVARLSQMLARSGHASLARAWESLDNSIKTGAVPSRPFVVGLSNHASHGEAALS